MTMPTDLSQVIQQTPMVDTHEHMRKETEYVEQGPDLLQSIFQNYLPSDLMVAGASQEGMAALMDANNPDLRARFTGIKRRGSWCATPAMAKPRASSPSYVTTLMKLLAIRSKVR